MQAFPKSPVNEVFVDLSGSEATVTSWTQVSQLTSANSNLHNLHYLLRAYLYFNRQTVSPYWSAPRTAIFCHYFCRTLCKRSSRWHRLCCHACIRTQRNAAGAFGSFDLSCCVSHSLDLQLQTFCAWLQVEGVEPLASPDDCILAEQIAKADPKVREMLKRRGVTNLDLVACDPWSGTHHHSPSCLHLACFVPWALLSVSVLPAAVCLFCLPACFLARLSVCVSVFLSACLPVCLPACLPLQVLALTSAVICMRHAANHSLASCAAGSAHYTSAHKTGVADHAVQHSRCEVYILTETVPMQSTPYLVRGDSYSCGCITGMDILTTTTMHTPWTSFQW